MRGAMAAVRECLSDTELHHRFRCLFMNRALWPILLVTAAVVAVVLFALSWVVQVWLERSFTGGEWAVVGATGVLAVAVYLQGRRQRERRKLLEMRDSALW